MRRSYYKSGVHLPHWRTAFILCVCFIVGVGLIMVTSASLSAAEKIHHDPFFFARRHLVYMVLGFVAMLITLRLSMRFWLSSSGFFLVLGIVLLMMVLTPGIGKEVNGSIRWIGLGGFTLQPSEFAKLFFMIYLAGYLVRRGDEVKTKWSGFIKPLVVLLVILTLLIAEPDFGSSVVLTTSAMGVIFLSGVDLKRFSMLCGVFCLVGALLVWIEPYRLQRMMVFTDPWADQYDSGYQLAQSLIAFGRGGWTGVGLGESVQKLFYLPEAHTDFVFAILAEELGMLGAALVTVVYWLWIGCILYLGRACEKVGLLFHAYLTYGLGIWMGLQATINMGVNIGMLPTKGLTLPLISYGGSSLLAAFVVIGILLRIEAELRSGQFELQSKTDATPSRQSFAFVAKSSGLRSGASRRKNNP